MGLLDVFLTASLASSFVGNNAKTSDEIKEYHSAEKIIELSCENSYLSSLNIDSIKKDQFDEYENDVVIQISKDIKGKNGYSPLFFAEFIPKDRHTAELNIKPNISCYQKQYINSRFCALSFNEIASFEDDMSGYKLLKIHTDPINVEQGGFGDSTEYYLCEVAKL